MKFLKGFVLSFFVLLALLLIIGLFLPAEFNVSRSITIDARPDSVYAKVADMQQWLKWNPWSALDPQAKSEISNPSTGPGAYWYWDGEKIGKGSMTLLAADSLKELELSLRFDEPKMDPSTILIQLTAANGKTTVTMINRGPLNYPLGRYFGLGLDSMLGPDFEKGLQNLSNLVTH